MSLIAAPTLALAALTSDVDYRDAWGTPKALTVHTAELVVSGLIVFVLAASMSTVTSTLRIESPWPNLSEGQNDLLHRAAKPLYWITLTGYFGFAVSGYRNSVGLDTVFKALIGQYSGDLKSALGRITGLTSLTQVGVAFVVVAMLVLVQRPDPRLARRLALVVILGVVRASLLTERLAMLELVVPMVAVLVLRRTWSPRPRTRWAVFLAPLVLIPLVLVAFGFFEYSRSWQFYKTRTTISYPEFVLERVGGYYSTAYNNGQLQLTYQRYPGRVPYDTIEALWTAPGVSQILSYPTPSGQQDPGTEFDTILKLHGNREFNSPGGLVIPFVDWGVPGGFVFLLIVGGGVGFLYRRCIEGKPFAVVLFPSMTTGLFELPRYVFWSLGRYTPCLVALGVVGTLVARRSSNSLAATDGAPADSDQVDPEPKARV